MRMIFVPLELRLEGGLVVTVDISVFSVMAIRGRVGQGWRWWWDCMRDMAKGSVARREKPKHFPSERLYTDDT